MNKICPVCKSSMYYIEPVKGYTDFYLTSRNDLTGVVDPVKGLPVKAFGCKQCGTIILHSDKLVENK